MAKPSEAEAAALAEAGPLLRFAAERVKDLSADFPLAIAEARAAAENDQWTPQVAQRFWDAFAKLCDRIQPVTMDCLLTGQSKVTAFNWWGLRRSRPQITLAEKSSGRYLVALISLLVLLILLQLYVWTSNNLSKKIDELFVHNQDSATRLSEDYKKLDSATHKLAQKEDWSTDQTAAADTIERDANTLNSDVDRMLYDANLLDKIAAFYIFPRTASSVPSRRKEDKTSGDDWWLSYGDATRRLEQARVVVLQVQEKANLFVGIVLSFILPVLFGTIGAVAYVVRTISDQIKKSTFSQSSPIRHLMRVALGALAGVVIGLFNGLSSQLSLSPLALAFLAGYGVEAVFSLFDALVDKFKQTQNASQTAADGKTP